MVKPQYVKYEQSKNDIIKNLNELLERSNITSNDVITTNAFSAYALLKSQVTIIELLIEILQRLDDKESG